MSPLAFIGAERYILSREFFGMKLGLENISQFLSDIGSPQHAFKAIHVSGTNGKGSTSAMLASILQSAGYKTGLFTSPHLISFRERVCVNGRPIPELSVAKFIETHKRALSRRKLTFFEVVTALAFDYFRRTKVDIAVIEVGLGGRLDATNVLHPLCTVTTDISFDHMEQLGHSLEAIASEKAGIIKQGVPHVVGILPPEAKSVMIERCRIQSSSFVPLSPSDFDPSEVPGFVTFHTSELSVRHTPLALYGAHQTSNAAVALKAVTILRTSGMRISEKAIKQGLKTTRWPGRFQIIQRRNHPLTVCDVGHNVGGVKAFVESFQTRFPNQKCSCIVGFVQKKEHQKMFDALSAVAAEFLLLKLKTRRSADPDEFLTGIDWRGLPARRVSSLDVAIRSLTKRVAHDDIIVVIGSHYLVGEFLEKYSR
jgi:dihydrofolate synthase / folylpolyglutamate synthase